jgi:DNA-binding NtrC family response regulator
MTAPRVLIVDDETKVLSSLKMALSLEGYQPDVAGDLKGARERFQKEHYDAVLLDVSLPDGNGVNFLGELKKADPSVIVVMMSGQATVEIAVKATLLGASDFLEKPISTDRTLIALRNALRLRAAEEEAGTLREESGQLRELRGESPKMKELKDLVARAARSNANVLLHGERGTGKELVARAIHEASPRAKKTLEKLNCAAIPENLIESELFGHEPGAFTGATKRRIGRFERADGGTLFLDEVGDMPAPMQAKLLRVLQERELERVGSSETIQVDVRVVAASNKDLRNECEEGRFRADLYDRLNVVPLHLPPLRERAGDIESLAMHFFNWARKRNDRLTLELSAEALQRIASHDFPGNVRELSNLMERIVILCPTERVDRLFVESCGLRSQSRDVSAQLYQEGHTFKELSEAAERTILEQALRKNDGQMAQTARALGLERSHLYKKAKSLGLRDT